LAMSGVAISHAKRKVTKAALELLLATAFNRLHEY